MVILNTPLVIILFLYMLTYAHIQSRPVVELINRRKHADKVQRKPKKV